MTASESFNSVWYYRTMDTVLYLVISTYEGEPTCSLFTSLEKAREECVHLCSCEGDLSEMVIASDIEPGWSANPFNDAYYVGLQAIVPK